MSILNDDLHLKKSDVTFMTDSVLIDAFETSVIDIVVKKFYRRKINKHTFDEYNWLKDELKRRLL